MQADETHHFSDSEDEVDAQDEEVAYEADEDVQAITQAAHEEAVEKLTQELARVSAEKDKVIETLTAKLNENTELFKKERSEHFDEMAKRQTRIDFLMDKMISN